MAVLLLHACVLPLISVVSVIKIAGHLTPAVLTSISLSAHENLTVLNCHLISFAFRMILKLHNLFSCFLLLSQLNKSSIA